MGAASTGASAGRLDIVARTAPAAMRKTVITPRVETRTVPFEKLPSDATARNAAPTRIGEQSPRISIRPAVGRRTAGCIVHSSPSSPRIRCWSWGCLVLSRAVSAKLNCDDACDGLSLSVSLKARATALIRRKSAIQTKGTTRIRLRDNRLDARIVSLRLSRRWSRFTSCAQAAR